MIENGNELLKETYLETMRENMGEWSRTVREYRRTFEISEEKLGNISTKEFKKEIQMRDSMRWEEKESKKLELCSRCKKKIGEEQIYKMTSTV